MTLPECLTLAEIFATTIFSVKVMHDCILLSQWAPITHMMYCCSRLGGKISKSSTGKYF